VAHDRQYTTSDFIMRSARALALLWIVATPSFGAAATLPGAAVVSIEQLVTKYMGEHQIPALAIAVVVNNEISWSKIYGTADLENKVPAMALTMFRTASIGKTMTATAAMTLVQAQRLDLKADIRTYCPAFPAKEWTITPRDLLSHLSGIRHYGGPRDKEEQGSTTHFAGVVDALAPFKDDALLFEPGTKFGYSTYGYDVAGCVIEGAAGMPFLAYMRKAVWEPAGMTSIRDDDPAAIIPFRAAGYTLVDNKIANAPHVDMSNRMAAGGYLTTIDDLARFVVALMSDRLVSGETFKQMITPAKLRNGEQVDYGLGWGMELEEWHGDTWVYHGGSSPGFSGFVALMPGHKYAVMFLTNLENLQGRNELAEGVTRIVLGF